MRYLAPVLIVLLCLGLISHAQTQYTNEQLQCMRTQLDLNSTSITVELQSRQIKDLQAQIEKLKKAEPEK